jgi:hypothetical protein
MPGMSQMAPAARTPNVAISKMHSFRDAEESVVGFFDNSSCKEQDEYLSKQNLGHIQDSCSSDPIPPADMRTREGMREQKSSICVALSLAPVWTRHADESYRARWESVQNDANEVGMGFTYLSNLSKPSKNSGERRASAPCFFRVAVLFTACTASVNVFFRVFLSLISPNRWRKNKAGDVLESMQDTIQPPM